MEERKYHGDIEQLRSPERVALMEVGRVIDLSLEGLMLTDVLDIGTGTGLFAETFLQRGLMVTGIDSSLKMVEAARQYVPLATIQQGSAEALTFPDRLFDLVFLGCVLHETTDQTKALSEAHRVCKKRVAVLEWPFVEEEKGPPLDQRMKPGEVEAIAREAGFQAIETIPLRHMMFYRMNVE